MGLTEAVARWIVDTNDRDIPDETKRATAVASFDAMGCMLAGSTQPSGKIMSGYVDELGGSPHATVVGTGQRTSAANAAFANGTFGHALDYDDRGMLSHAASLLLAALMAIGEKINASGNEILEATIIGREVGHALSEGMRHVGFHKMAVFGRIGATVACAKLLRLDLQQIQMALGIAGSMASGVSHNHGTMTKPLHAGLAARDGVIAAEMAGRGWTTGDRTLEHPAGFMASFCGDSVNVWSLIKNLGKPFRAQDTVGIKKYPCGGANHRVIDGLLALMEEHAFDYHAVEEVEVPQSYQSHYIMVAKPRTGLEAKFSMVYIPAATLVQGHIDIDTFTDERVQDVRIQATMEKIKVRVLSQWEVGLDRAESRWPGGSTGHTNRAIKVRLKDGRVLTKHIPPDQVLGEPKNPWAFENIRSKFAHNARLALSEAQAAEAEKVWSNMERIKSIRDAVRCLVA
jgi:2-methylcitrate dehydratase PrpD